MQWKSYTRMLRQFAEEASQRMRESAPVDTGKLRDSIEYVVIAGSGPPNVEFQTLGYGELLDDENSWASRVIRATMNEYHSKLEEAMHEDIAASLDEPLNSAI